MSACWTMRLRWSYSSERAGTAGVDEGAGVDVNVGGRRWAPGSCCGSGMLEVVVED